MGRTLYDTIYLGRHRLSYSRRARVALALGLAIGLAASTGLGWLALRA